MLIKCEDCGNDVSSRAASCPRCGCPISTGAAPAYDGPLGACGACNTRVSTFAPQCPACGSPFCEVSGCTETPNVNIQVSGEGGGSLGGLVRLARVKAALATARRRCSAHQEGPKCGGCGAILLADIVSKAFGDDVPVRCNVCDTVLCSVEGCFQPEAGGQRAGFFGSFKAPKCSRHG